MNLCHLVGVQEEETHNIKYDNTTKDFYIEESLGNNVFNKIIVSLKDPDYFCNKSWTLSFNVNTKTWISFHSYIPNWYIAENNFFYSGINGCCDEFDFVAGELVPTPSTTTTTSSSTSSTTTTSSSTTINPCLLAGNVILTSCELEGTGVITVPPVPPPCQRPIGMQTLNFITGYNIISPPSIVVSTASQTNACDAISYIDSQSGIEPFPITLTYILVDTFSITVGQIAYDGTTGTDCTVIADGWYFTDETANSGIVFNVVGGYIMTIVNCNPTTTTTTTANCFSFTISKTSTGVVTVSYTDCSGNPQTVNVGNSGGGPSSQTFCARNGSVTTPPGVSLLNNGPC